MVIVAQLWRCSRRLSIRDHCTSRIRIGLRVHARHVSGAGGFLDRAVEDRTIARTVLGIHVEVNDEIKDARWKLNRSVGGWKLVFS
jgi:hypothetical protein